MNSKKKFKLDQIELKSFITELNTLNISGGQLLQEVEGTLRVCTGLGLVCDPSFTG